MILKTQNILLLIFVSFTLFSCGSKKKIVYLQGVENAASYESAGYEPKLKPDDLLRITVSAQNPEVAVPFNGASVSSSSSNIYTEGQNYLVDSSGSIDFPILGKVQLTGLTTKDANSKLSGLISEYIKNPSINIRILNFKVSVLGEVAKPGSYNIQGERISVFDALSLAGDLTVYGKRTNILVVHEEDGKKTYSRIDITKGDFLKSSSYYLSQNDLVFVEPNRTKVASSVIGPNTSIILTAVSILISVSVILFRL